MHFSTLLGPVALATLTLAQTWSSCNPTLQTCPADKGLNVGYYHVDFTRGADADWPMILGEAAYDQDGVAFSLAGPAPGPTMESDFYFFFGTISVVAKSAKGAGIVSCVVLESDDLDELDWEWLGGDATQVQSNWYGKGNTETYDRGGFHPIADNQDTFHNYTIEWTPDFTRWYIDSELVRTLNFAEAVAPNTYPQTPMRVKMGIWSAAETGNAGTIEWAGGSADYSQGPFSMNVQSVTIVNQNPATSYTYADFSGTWQSIQKA
ncbi:glycosyl hydrolases family 16 domain-containing protein [Sarocladium implicatum]|nr:glycosyl hydrolases family 16 domain-containing protein [Sarocladium implicatum]